MADGASPEKFEQALKNVLAVLAEADGAPEHICRMTVYCTDKAAYKRRTGLHLATIEGTPFPGDEHDLRH